MDNQHPDTFVCQFCGETTPRDDMPSHYILSGLHGCVNKQTSVVEQNMWRERLYRKIEKPTEGAEWLWDKDAYLAQLPLPKLQEQIALLTEMVNLNDPEFTQPEKEQNRWREALVDYLAELERRWQFK